MAADDKEAFHHGSNNTVDAAERELNEQEIRRRMNSLILLILLITGASLMGFIKFLYPRTTPGFWFLLAAVGGALWVAPHFVRRQVARRPVSRSARTRRHIIAADIALEGALLFLALAGIALFLAFVVMLLFGLLVGWVDYFILVALVVAGVVWLVMALAVMLSYFSRRARNLTEPAPTSFEHVLRTSGGICLHGCSTAFFFSLFCLMSVLVVRTVDEGPITALPLVPFAIFAALSIWLSASHARMLTSDIKGSRGDA
jgi:hypothetical protein